MPKVTFNHSKIYTFPCGNLFWLFIEEKSHAFFCINHQFKCVKLLFNISESCFGFKLFFLNKHSFSSVLVPLE